MIFKKINEFRKIRSELFFPGASVVYKKDDAIVEIDGLGVTRELFSNKENFVLEKADATGLYIRDKKGFFKLKDGRADKTFHWPAPGKRQIKYIDGDLFLLRSEQPDGTWKALIDNSLGPLVLGA